MLTFLILISYLNLSNFPANIYYQEELSQHSSLLDSFLIIDNRYNGQFLYLEQGKNLGYWSDEVFINNFRKLLTEEIQKKEGLSKKRSTEGLIPDLDIDFNMPRGLSAILGEGGHIEVEGFEEIDVELKQTRQTLREESYSSFPQIVLKERLNAKIEGTVGEKLHVEIDQDQDRLEQDNVMKIWYGGRDGMDSQIEDDIVQELRLGHIQESGSEKLFGIATRGGMGSTSFNLSAGKLESDETSGSDAVNISSDSIVLNEEDYLREEYFYIGLPHPSDSLISYGLFKGYNTTVRPSTLMDLEGNLISEEAYFLELVEGEDYKLGEFVMQDRPPLPYFHMLKKYDISGKRLGVYLVYADSTGKIDTLGRIERDPEDSTIIDYTLYQLKSDDPDPSDPSWNYQMRNIYRFGTSDPSRIEVEIYRKVSAGNNIRTNNEKREYSEVLGITTPEGKVISSRILRDEGCIVFPDSFPFLNPGLDADTVPEIYRELPGSYTNERYGDNYGIVVKTTSASSGSFRLKSNGPIIEGSEKLTVDGRLLKKGIDYKINYMSGQVELLNRGELPPDAKINYEFRSQPFFSFDSKYKAQLNVKAKPFENSNLDFDLNFLSRSDKGVFHPTVGKEPSNMTLGKVDFSLNREPEFLNNLFGNLPFVDEDSKSGFNINGSYGFSLPNPATSGKSYLDDMESVDQPVPVNLGAGLWYYCSQPDSSVNIDDLAKLDWFTDLNYPKSRIFPEFSKTSSSDRLTNALVLYFRPDNVDNWGGIMRTFNPRHNLSQKNFLEVWIKADEGEMIFEMGDKMSEDLIRWGKSSTGADSIIPPNGEWDTEDKNGDGDLQDGEDTGLDGIKMDDDDWTYYPDSLDDGVDDCVIKPKSFSDSLKTHNNEGNNRLDSEDLNRDYTFETENNFFRYKIDITSGEYLAKEGLDGWKVFIIPLKDSSSFEKIGDPSFEDIVYTRMWFKGMNEDTRITVGKIDIVGSKWENKGVRLVSNDSLNTSGGDFKVSSRNTFEDEDYVPPVELIKETGGYAFRKEQSLALEIDSLTEDNYCLIQNYLNLPIKTGGRGYDFRLYSALNFYTQYNGNTSDSAEVFLRLLTDSNNYYQYKTTAYLNDWDTVDVSFEKFTDLKIDNGDTIDGKYSLKGSPSLKSISFLQLGVVNNSNQTLKGEVLIDDIILTGADNRMGSDLDLNISTNVGDLITNVSYNIGRKSANYKNRLDALRELGDKEVASNTFRITADAGKFLNGMFNCPVAFSIGESHKTPIYKINSDVSLLPEQAESLTEKRYSRDITASVARRSTSDNWFLKHTIDNVKLSGSYREEKSLNPLKKADTTISTTGSIRYNLPLPRLSLPVFSSESSSLLPKEAEFRTSYEYKETESYNYKDSLYEKLTLPFKKELSSYAGITFEPIRWLDVDYSINATNDLRERESFSESFSLSELGQAASLREEINAKHRSEQFGFNNLNITYRSNFNQNHETEYSKSLGDSLDVRNCKQQRTIRISDNIQLSSILEKIPLISRFSKSLSPLRFSANFNKDGDFSYLSSQPDYKFRYGFESLPDTSLFERVEKTDGGYYNEVYTISSGFSSSKINLKVDARYTHKGPDRLQKENTQTPRETRELSWPDISVDFPNIQKYVPFIDNYVRRASVSFSIGEDTSSIIGIGEKDFFEGSYSSDMSMSLDMDFKNGLGVTITPNFNSNRNYPDSKLNRRGSSKGVSVNCDYTIKPSSEGFPLLFFGRVKFDKPVTLRASFTYKENLGYKTDSYGDEAKSEDNSTITFNLTGNYNFSETVSGGLTIDFRNYKNRKIGDLSSTSYGGSFNVRLKF